MIFKLFHNWTEQCTNYQIVFLFVDNLEDICNYISPHIDFDFCSGNEPKKHQTKKKKREKGQWKKGADVKKV